MIPFKKIKILGCEFDVIQTDQNTLREVSNSGPDTQVIGLCDDLDDRLYIVLGLNPKPERRTFIHEWAHGVKSVSGIGQTIDPVTAESVCQSFANALIEMLEQSAVMEFLMGRDEKAGKAKSRKPRASKKSTGAGKAKRGYRPGEKNKGRD